MSFHFVCFPAFLSFLSISYIFDVSYNSHISPPKKNYISLPDVHKNWLIRLQVWMPDLRRCWCAKSAISKSFYDQLRSSLSLCTLLKVYPIGSLLVLHCYGMGIQFLFAFDGFRRLFRLWILWIRIGDNSKMFAWHLCLSIGKCLKYYGKIARRNIIK